MSADARNLLLLAGRASLALVRGRIDARETIRHVERFALGAAGTLAVGGVVVGGVVAMQGLGYVSRYGASEVFGWAASLSAFREVGPMLLGFALAARMGGRNAAELAAMSAREQVDALRALGLSAHRVVYYPRLLAMALSSILLFPLLAALTLTASFLLAWGIGGQRLSVSFYSFREYLGFSVFLEGWARFVAFGVLSALASTHAGTRGVRDARGVGHAVFDASVLSIAGISLLHAILTFAPGLMP